MRIFSFAFAIGLLVAISTSVLGHEITKIKVECTGPEQGITATGKLFGENLPIIVTLTNNEDYLETFEVTTDDWTHTFPLGPNGHYSLDWPDSGDFGPVLLTVQCNEATPTPIVTPRPTPIVVGSPSPTPKPHRTLPPTDTE